MCKNFTLVCGKALNDVLFWIHNIDIHWWDKFIFHDQIFGYGKYVRPNTLVHGKKSLWGYIEQEGKHAHLHFFGDEDHFVKGGSDETRQTEHVCAHLLQNEYDFIWAQTNTSAIQKKAASRKDPSKSSEGSKESIFYGKLDQPNNHNHCHEKKENRCDILLMGLSF